MMLGDPTEELLSEMRPYLARIPRLGMALRSPLVYSVPYAPAMAWFANRLYRQKRAQVDAAIAKGDWDRVISLHERPYRLNAFCEHSGLMSDKEYWSLASHIYVDTENADQLYPLWRTVVEANRKGREHFMLPGEHKAFAALPDVLVVYRGCTGPKIRDLSWTLDLDVAWWFAQRFEARGFVLRGEVRKADTLGYLMRRNEEEIAVLPEHVQNTRRLRSERTKTQA